MNTHILPLAKRWGVVGADEKRVGEAGGSEYCQARKHACATCPICCWCNLEVVVAMPKSEAEIAQLFASNPPLPKANPSIIKAAQRAGMVASRDSDNAMGLPGHR